MHTRLRAFPHHVRLVESKRCARTSAFVFAFLAALLGSPGHARAQSFALNEHSAIELGRASSGGAVQADDASVAFGNPAAMMQIEKPTVTTVLSGVWGDAVSFTDGGSVDLSGTPLGLGADDFLNDAAIPAVHIVYPMADRWTLGFSLSAPFGLATKYEDGWAGRYQSLRSELITININPSVAYRVSDNVSVGLGASAMYADAELTNAIDFGAVCLGALGPAACMQLGLAPQRADGGVIVAGDDWGFGINAGLSWSPASDVLLGFHYRSEVRQKLEGSAQFSVPAAAAILTAGGAFKDVGASAEIDLPATAEAGIRWRAGARTTVYADLRWRGWSRVEEVRVRFKNAVQRDAVDELLYRDTTRLAAGVDYRLDSHWTVRAGFAQDQTPTRSALRTARIPDDDRDYYAIGASWASGHGWQVDLAYNRIEIAAHAFERVGDFSERLRGAYSGAANVLSVGLTRRL